MQWMSLTSSSFSFQQCFCTLTISTCILLDMTMRMCRTMPTLTGAWSALVCMKQANEKTTKVKDKQTKKETNQPSLIFVLLAVEARLGLAGTVACIVLGGGGQKLHWHKTSLQRPASSGTLCLFWSPPALLCNLPHCIERRFSTQASHLLLPLTHK